MRTDELSSLCTQLQETIHHLLLFTVQRGTEQVVCVQISGLELCIMIRTANISHARTHTNDLASIMGNHFHLP
jgi:GTP cyclohydrolase I